MGRYVFRGDPNGVNYIKYFVNGVVSHTTILYGNRVLQTVVHNRT